MMGRAALAGCLALLLAALVRPGLSQAQPHEDGLILVRCSGFQVPVIAFPGTELLGHRVETEPFDVVLHIARGRGWFRGALIHVGPDQPARLTVEAQRYILYAEQRREGLSLTEQVVLDRVDGTVSHSSQARGSPASILKSGGQCRQIDRRF